MQQYVSFPIPYMTMVPVPSTPQVFIFLEASIHGTEVRNRNAIVQKFSHLYENEKLELKKLQLLSEQQRQNAIEAPSEIDSRNCRNQSGGSACSVQLLVKNQLQKTRTEYKNPKAIEASIDPDFDISRNHSEANG